MLHPLDAECVKRKHIAKRHKNERASRAYDRARANALLHF